MKRLLLLITVSLFSSGCLTVPLNSYELAQKRTRVLNMNKEAFYNELQNALVAMGVSLSSVDKNAGIIISDTFSMTIQEFNAYSGFWFGVTEARAKLTISMTEVLGYQTKVIVSLTIEGFNQFLDGRWHMCQSNGKFEENLLNEIEKAINRNKP